ncbi:MAG: hypothetical protein R6U91_07950 [Bacillota bacterium]
METNINLYNKNLAWLLEGDVSIVYQVKRDLLKAGTANLSTLQKRIATEGWGRKLLEARRPDGHWGREFYQPKWTCTHYALLDLKTLGLPPSNQACRDTVKMVLAKEPNPDGGLAYAKTINISDICVDGMFLGVAVYFEAEEDLLKNGVDLLLRTVLPEGGWNCLYHQGDRHFSVHTTINVLEGLLAYSQAGYRYRLSEVEKAIAAGEEQLLIHQLYQSHRTGEPMDPKMTMLSFPSRWHYDILRALNYFHFANRPFDPRMANALAIIKTKRRKDGTWPLQARYPGKVHFDMEQPGKPSRWNTLRALRVLMHFNQSF